MTFSHLYAIVLAFCGAHQAVVTFGILSFVGLLHDVVEKYPRLQGIAKICKAFGLSSDTLVAGLKQILLGANKAAVIASGACLLILGCGPSQPAKTPAQARAQARAAVTSVESAWMLAAHTCVDVASLQPSGSVLAQCASVLEPIRTDLEVADAIVNAWTTETSNATLACKLSQSAAEIASAAELVGVSGAAVQDAVTVVGALVSDMGGCVGDAGKGDSK